MSWGGYSAMMKSMGTSTCAINPRGCALPMDVYRSSSTFQNGANHGPLSWQPRNGWRSKGRELPQRAKQEGREGRRAVTMGAGVQVQERSKDGVAKEDAVQTVVIVGAGLAGLATALALHRVGVKAMVLEQSESLRTEGTSLSLFPNAWRALDALGVADKLRGSYLGITGARMRSPDGKVIKEFQNADLPGGPHELRAVERQALLRVLAEALPRDTIIFNSRVKNIRKPRDMQFLTEVELDNNTVIRTKVLVGCDGARSVVASWMGRPEPQSVGQTAIRGLSDFKSNHNFEPMVQQIIGKGIRAGLVPATENKVYWFISFNSSPSVPSRISDPNKIKEEALSLVQGWPSDINECIQNTPLESFNRSTLRDRWLIPLVTPQQASNGITLAGDAAHPMTPNLAQGGCTSLEDSVILTRKLCEALRVGKKEEEDASVVARRIGTALTEYESERWARTFRLTVKSHVFGSLLALDSSLICFLRDTVGLPVLFRASVVFGSSKFDCGALPPPLD